jgi:exopolysaccharide biosynthesis polyprenyl glycosylphosphotransferase
MSFADNISVVSREQRHLRSVNRPPMAQDDQPNHLRLVLIALDAVGLIAGWAIILFFTFRYRSTAQDLKTLAGALVAGLWVMHKHDLYLARISSIRSAELSRVIRSLMLDGLIVLALNNIFDIKGGLRIVVPGVVLSTLFVMIGRSAYRAWLTAQRRNGRFLRDVMLLGANDETRDLLDLIADHPETGYRVVGVLGNRDAAMAHGLGHLWCGVVEEAAEALEGRRVRGVIVATTALLPGELNDTVRDLQAHRMHIQLSNGMRGVDFRRLTAAPIAYEPIFYLEPAVLSKAQLVLKRSIDLVVGAFALIFAAPVMLGIALAVKLQDGGPILFRQLRVGRDGERFKVLKFRTMVIDAEAKLAALRAENERSGPLFKMQRDPRITRLGHFLRNSSLDELPQLFNVIAGQMSLVGPRPALPAEVALFDDALLNRTKVPPGITGLWQVEARDNPSFAAYRRLDLFYVENWSVSLDIVILLATLEQVIAKLVQSLFHKGRPAK